MAAGTDPIIPPGPTRQSARGALAPTRSPGYAAGMAFTYPQFNEPTWSAKFDSYDQRNDDVYYIITLPDGKRFMAQVSVAWAGDDWTTPEFTERLRKELERIAATGTTNTTHRGGVVPSI